MPGCLVIQHVEPEGPYAIGDALIEAGVGISLCRIFAGEPVPASMDRFDALVVMGGPMSATSDEGFPTRSAEIRVIADALMTGKPVLGICLGAQLLALAAGGSVFVGNEGPEIGWGTVELTDAASEDPLFAGRPTELEVLHWHGDTFTVPEDAVRLATSRSYSNQAFRYGQSAWGLQFHVEVDTAAVDEFLRCFGDDTYSVGSSPESVRAATPAALSRLGPWQDRIVSRFATLVAASAGAGAGADHRDIETRTT